MDKSQKIRFSVEVKKPLVLYHASPNGNIEVLEPRVESKRHPDEGPVIFATAAKPYQFLGPGGDSWTRTMMLNGVLIHVISDREKYLKEDKGGFIYSLPSDTFNNEYPKYGGSKYEWTSRVPVKPFDKEFFESALRAQLEHGIQVFFVDKDTFKRITDAADHGKAIIRTLESENDRTGIEPRKIPNQLDGPLL